MKIKNIIKKYQILKIYLLNKKNSKKLNLKARSKTSKTFEIIHFCV